jgi:IS5 family transposase
MLVDCYPPMNLFALAPDLATGFEPVLRELDRLLEDKVILQAIKADMARRSRRSLTAGRPGTPVEVIVRLIFTRSGGHLSKLGMIRAEVKDGSESADIHG